MVRDYKLWSDQSFFILHIGHYCLSWNEPNKIFTYHPQTTLNFLHLRGSSCTFILLVGIPQPVCSGKPAIDWMKFFTVGACSISIYFMLEDNRLWRLAIDKLSEASSLAPPKSGFLPSTSSPHDLRIRRIQISISSLEPWQTVLLNWSCLLGN